MTTVGILGPFICIVGADHNYIFQEELMIEPVELLYPLR